MRLPGHGCGVCSVAAAGRQCCSLPRSRVYLTAGWRLQRRALPRSRDCRAAGSASAASSQHVVEKCRSLPHSRVYLATCAAPASSYGARLQRCLPPRFASPRVCCVAYCLRRLLLRSHVCLAEGSASAVWSLCGGSVTHCFARAFASLQAGVSSVARCLARMTASPRAWLLPFAWLLVAYSMRRLLPRSHVCLAEGSAYAAWSLRGGSVTHFFARAYASLQAGVSSVARCLTRVTASPRAWLLQRSVACHLALPRHGSASAASLLQCCSVAQHLARATAPPRAGPLQLRSLLGYSIAYDRAHALHGVCSVARCLSRVTASPRAWLLQPMASVASLGLAAASLTACVAYCLAHTSASPRAPRMQRGRCVAAVVPTASRVRMPRYRLASAASRAVSLA
jgi:hypothetical protein